MTDATPSDYVGVIRFWRSVTNSSPIAGALVALLLGGAILGFARWSGATGEPRGAMNETA